MQKLFVLLRQGNLDEVKRLITKKPELINSVSGARPKKDHGQSLLQVALKSGRLTIADYLLEAGIDVNFMEEADDDPGLRAPVLFDAVTAVLMSLCTGVFCTPEEVEERFEQSDRALELLQKMLRLGADVNKRTSHDMSIINWSLHHAEGIMGSPKVYPYSQEKVRKQLRLILDCLFEYGADYEAWLAGGYYPEPCPGPAIRELFWCDPKSLEATNQTYQSMREFLHDYFPDVVYIPST